MRLSPDRDVLLFYEDFETDTLLPNDRLVKRAARRVVHALRPGRQKVTGFYVWFRMLHDALTRAGRRVFVNERSLARRNPRFPVGLCGYPHVLRHFSLPNPAVLGPGLFDHPKQAPKLMEDPRYRAYIVTCEWMRELFQPYYGDRCVLWHGGIDTDAWADASGRAKALDFIVYDKLRFDRAAREKSLLEPILAELERRKLTFTVMRYGRYDHEGYRRALERSRGLLFLCEHETQGMAYQEAMAMNVPVLAWDNGSWLDPRRAEFEAQPVRATSVPYFAAECGERFAEFAQFVPALDAFLARRAQFRPRDFVLQRLSREDSARRWLSAYLPLMPR